MPKQDSLLFFFLIYIIIAAGCIRRNPAPAIGVGPLCLPLRVAPEDRVNEAEKVGEVEEELPPHDCYPEDCAQQELPALFAEIEQGKPDHYHDGFHAHEAEEDPLHEA